MEAPLHIARICSSRTLYPIISTKGCLLVSSRILIGPTALAFPVE